VSKPPPVIVIGAGRSGTNLLRDIISSLDGFDTWPCDEINYIWRHGNRSASTDELQPSDARPDVRRYIRRAFDRQQSRAGGGAVVEKTCANSLRVGFVNQVFPDARIVYIMRDARDVVASAMERWTASLDVGYLARKARFVPPADLPYYALKYARSRLNLFGAGERRLSTWGPRFEGLGDLVGTRTLAEVCAHQWSRCVASSAAQLDAFVDPSRVLRVRYEVLVTEPTVEIRRVAVFLAAEGLPMYKTPKVRASSVGRWRTALTLEQQESVTSIVGEQLSTAGYVV